MARVFGLPVELITPGEIGQLMPLARVDDLVGGVFLPGDGVTNPVDTTQALAGSPVQGRGHPGSTWRCSGSCSTATGPSASSVPSRANRTRSAATSWSTPRGCGGTSSVALWEPWCRCTPPNTLRRHGAGTPGWRRTCRCCGTRTDTATSRRMPASCWSGGSSRRPNRGVRRDEVAGAASQRISRSAPARRLRAPRAR